jgi:CO/xanthine dehydrogenase Mo-binding subunit
LQAVLTGGITYGIGIALLEETLVDEGTGRIVNTNVAD